MSYRGTLNKVHELHSAWNERRWTDYADIFAADLIAHSADGALLEKHEYVLREQQFCQTYPDSQVHTDPHLALFGDPDGARICTVSRLTGTFPDFRSGVTVFDVTIAVIYLWRNGHVIEHRQYFDLKGGPILMHGLPP